MEVQLKEEIAHNDQDIESLTTQMLANNLTAVDIELQKATHPLSPVSSNVSSNKVDVLASDLMILQEKSKTLKASLVCTKNEILALKKNAETTLVVLQNQQENFSYRSQVRHLLDSLKMALQFLEQNFEESVYRDKMTPILNSLEFSLSEIYIAAWSSKLDSKLLKEKQTALQEISKQIETHIQEIEMNFKRLKKRSKNCCK